MVTTRLFEELGKSCMICTKLRAKFMNSVIGPCHPSSYALAQAFWIVQADLFGPVATFVPGKEQNTRANPALSAKCWVMVFRLHSSLLSLS